MRRIGSVFVLSFLLACGVARSEPVAPWASLADPVFVGVDPRGMTHPRVYSLAQDPTGFIWIGTQNGIGRYDGYRSRVFLPNPADPAALPEGDVRTLLSDPRGVLWIGTSSSGLVRFDETTETFHTWRSTQNGRLGPRSANIVALAQSRDGRLWLAGDGGLDRFDPATQRFEHMNLTPANQPQPRVEALLIDRRGTVWVATLRGLYYRSPRGREFHLFNDLSPTKDATQPSLFSLHEDRDGRIWTGSLNSVFVLSPKRRLDFVLRSSADPMSLAPGEEWAIVEVADGTVWVGSEDGELSIVDVARKVVRRIPASAVNSRGRNAGEVWQFLRDRSGLVWIADGFGGLSTYNTRSHGIYNLAISEPRLGRSDQGAWSIALTAGGHLWIGGTRGELSELDPRTGVRRILSTPNRLPVNTIAVGRGGVLWVGTDGAICRLQPGSNELECP